MGCIRRTQRFDTALEVVSGRASTWRTTGLGPRQLVMDSTRNVTLPNPATQPILAAGGNPRPRPEGHMPAVLWPPTSFTDLIYQSHHFINPFIATATLDWVRHCRLLLHYVDHYRLPRVLDGISTFIPSHNERSNTHVRLANLLRAIWSLLMLGLSKLSLTHNKPFFCFRTLCAPLLPLALATTIM